MCELYLNIKIIDVYKRQLQYDKELYVFSSHAHHDHYTKDIFKLENKCKKVVYVLSSDIKRASSFWKKAENVLFLSLIHIWNM